MAFLQTLKEEASKNIREGLRDKFESSTGIVGQTFRDRREKAERQQEIDEQVGEINLQTSKIAATGATLGRLESAFLQISDNVQVLAKAMDAYVTTREETNKALGQSAQQVKQSTTAAAPPAAIKELVDDKEEKSLFDKISGLFDRFRKNPKQPPKQPPKRRPSGRERTNNARTRAEEAAKKRGAPKEEVKKAGQKAAEKAAQREAGKEASKAAIKAAAKKSLSKTIGKIAAKSIPIVGVGVGVAFAVSRLLRGDVAGAGIEVAGGLAGPLTSIPAEITNTARDIFFEEYGHYPDPRDPADVAKLKTIYEGVKETAEEMLGQKVDTPKAEEAKKPTPSAVQTVNPNSELPPSSLALLKPPVAVPSSQAVATSSVPTNAIRTESGGTLTTSSGDAVKSSIPSADTKPPAAPPPTTAPTAAAAPVAKPPVAATAPTTPADKPTGLVGSIVNSLKESGITSIKAISNILATIKAETGFKVRSEDTFYRSAESIQKTFGKDRIPTLEFAQQFVGKPEELANEVYKKTDGNSAPGDGYKYRGRGWIQHTGKNQYAAIAKFSGVDVLNNPDLLNDPAVASKALAWFFLKYKKKKPEQLESIGEVNSAVGFADTTGQKAKDRAASAELITADISGGQDLEKLNANVATAKKPTGRSNVTVIAVNNTTEIRKAASPQPRKESTTMVG